MSYQEFLSFERRGAVGIVRLARPEKLNTISAPFYEAMIELQQAEIVGDHDLRAIALLADGRHFSAGIDLNYAKAVIGKPGRSLYGVYHWQQAYRFWSECNLPVVVGIQGACMGTAIELITACDIRIAADNAKFSLREVDVGISTDLGGTTRLTKLIGPGMTKLLAMTCEDIDAQEAARIRLVERVVPLGELEQTTLAYAEKLAADLDGGPRLIVAHAQASQLREQQAHADMRMVLAQQRQQLVPPLAEQKLLPDRVIVPVLKEDEHAVLILHHAVIGHVAPRAQLQHHVPRL